MKSLPKVKKWCDFNKLSINIITENINIKITNKDGTIYCLERKDHIKYLGVLIDEKLSWKYHIAYICSRLARNIGIFYKLRHYMTLARLKQLYYSLIYPYISYAILACGSTYKTQIKKVQIKQNTVIRVIFFAITYGQNTESALPFMRLLDILDFESLYKLQFLSLLIYGKEMNYRIFFMTIFSLLVMSIHIIRGMPPERIFINLELELTLENSLYLP